MQDDACQDWHTKIKEIPFNEWDQNFNWIEDPCVSPDGEKIASIVNIDEDVFGVCVNGELWEETFEKAWSLKFLPDGRLAVLANIDDEWTVCVDGSFWKNRFDYIWDLQWTPSCSHICVAIQKDMEYGMAVNDCVWENFYKNITGTVLSNEGVSAGIVQVATLSQADIKGFSSGVFSAAVNGVAHENRFMNIWDISFDSRGSQIAYSVRKNRVDYSLVKNNIPWDKNFQCAWKPVFIDNGSSVIAPVKKDGKWFLFRDGEVFWTKSFEQLWKVTVSPCGGKIAAVVSNIFGKWTVCENQQTWNIHADGIISDLSYSVDGRLLIAVLKDKGFWDIAVNSKRWGIKADKLWEPVVSSDNELIVTRMENGAGYFLVVNGTVYPERYDFIFKPAISSKNNGILLKAIKKGIYIRRILSVDEFLLNS